MSIKTQSLVLKPSSVTSQSSIIVKFLSEISQKAHPFSQVLNFVRWPRPEQVKVSYPWQAVQALQSVNSNNHSFGVHSVTLYSSWQVSKSSASFSVLRQQRVWYWNPFPVRAFISHELESTHAVHDVVQVLRMILITRPYKVIRSYYMVTSSVTHSFT